MSKLINCKEYSKLYIAAALGKITSIYSDIVMGDRYKNYI